MADLQVFNVIEFTTPNGVCCTLLADFPFETNFADSEFLRIVLDLMISGF